MIRTQDSNDGDERKEVVIVYVNYRGEKSERRIVPRRIWFGETEWHPEEQWLLDAYDLDKQSLRSFALKSVLSWRTRD